MALRRALALFLVLAACTPAAAPIDWPSSPEGACNHLEELGCPEAKPAADGSTCPMVVRRAQRLVDMKLACITAAADVDALRACGTVRCRD